MTVIQTISLLSAVAALCTTILATPSDPDPHQLLLTEANNKFAFHLYQTLANDPISDNIFFSPMSISVALAMTSLGARGTTASQMKDVLKFNTLEESRLHSTFAELSSVIFNVNDKYTLRKANRLFGHKDLDLRHEFLEDTDRYYSSNMASLDFVQETEKARQFINSWVGQETEDKIKDLLPHGSITGMTQLVLVNAIYFKADWIGQFDKLKTFDQDFYVSNDQVIEVPMMHRKSRFNFAQDITMRCKIIELPYVGKDFSMVIALPEEINGIHILKKQLTNEKLQHLLNNLSNVTVDVAIPKFKLEETLYMNDVLYSMGMEDLFLRDKADLSGITGTKDLFVSSVIHRAFLEVNEEGSEAAAATGVTISKRSISHTPEFVADHPFLFFISDSNTRAIIFMGHCCRPADIGLNHEEL